MLDSLMAPCNADKGNKLSFKKSPSDEVNVFMFTNLLYTILIMLSCDLHVSVEIICTVSDDMHCQLCTSFLQTGFSTLQHLASVCILVAV